MSQIFFMLPKALGANAKLQRQRAVNEAPYDDLTLN